MPGRRQRLHSLYGAFPPFGRKGCYPWRCIWICGDRGVLVFRMSDIAEMPERDGGIERSAGGSAHSLSRMNVFVPFRFFKDIRPPDGVKASASVQHMRPCHFFQASGNKVRRFPFRQGRFLMQAETYPKKSRNVSLFFAIFFIFSYFFIINAYKQRTTML